MLKVWRLAAKKLASKQRFVMPATTPESEVKRRAVIPMALEVVVIFGDAFDEASAQISLEIMRRQVRFLCSSL